MSRLAAASLLALAGACSAPRVPPSDLEPLPLTETRRVYYPGGEQLKKRYMVLNEPGQEPQKHGKEEEWFADGARQAERFFERGAPNGTWRTWHADGAPESVVEIGDASALLPMRWWYEDGTLHAEGQGRGGVREGVWTYHHRNGGVSERGPFERGRRHGRWESFDEAGRLRADGLYEEGRRVGLWRLWDERGVLHEKQGDPPRGTVLP